jgi:hypothetical protein
VGLFLRVSGIVAVLLVFLGAGYEFGHKPSVVVNATQRFLPNGDGTAFDTITGKTCQMTLNPSGSCKASETCDGTPTKFDPKDIIPDK